MCPQGVIDFRKFHYNKNCKCFAFICFASFRRISLLFTIFHFTWVYFWICHPNSGTCIASSVTEYYCLAINFRHLLCSHCFSTTETGTLLLPPHFTLPLPLADYCQRCLWYAHNACHFASASIDTLTATEDI